MKQKIHAFIASLPIWARCLLGIALIPACVVALPLLVLAVAGNSIVETVEDFLN
jgi:hypothetical protein